jgi:hypothetical protein
MKKAASLMRCFLILSSTEEALLRSVFLSRFFMPQGGNKWLKQADTQVSIARQKGYRAGGSLQKADKSVTNSP